MNEEYDLPMNIIIPSVGGAILALIVVIIVISSKCCKLKKCRKIQQEDINNFNEL